MTGSVEVEGIGTPAMKPQATTGNTLEGSINSLLKTES
jgi:hypothetical protein